MEEHQILFQRTRTWVATLNQGRLMTILDQLLEEEEVEWAQERDLMLEANGWDNMLWMRIKEDRLSRKLCMTLLSLILILIPSKNPSNNLQTDQVDQAIINPNTHIPPPSTTTPTIFFHPPLLLQPMTTAVDCRHSSHHQSFIAILITIMTILIM